MADNENPLAGITLEIGNMSVKEQITEIEKFQVKLIRGLDKLKDSADSKTRLETVRTMSGLIKNVQMSLQKQREMEIKEDVDFTSPKARRGMMILIETFFDSMMESQIDDSAIDTVKSVLQVKLMGFEEKLTKELKGVSGELLDDVKNPLS